MSFFCLKTKGRSFQSEHFCLVFGDIFIDWCAGISVGKEKLKFKNDLTSLDDKLRIANKVNNKYLELGGWMKQKLDQKVIAKSDPF